MASAAGGQEESETTKTFLELKLAMGSEGRRGGHHMNTEKRSHEHMQPPCGVSVFPGAGTRGGSSFRLNTVAPIN